MQFFRLIGDSLNPITEGLATGLVTSLVRAHAEGRLRCAPLDAGDQRFLARVYGVTCSAPIWRC